MAPVGWNDRINIQIAEGVALAFNADGDQIHVSVGTEIAAVEKQLILATLEHFEGDKKKAAQTLGISLKTLYNRLKAYKG